MHTSIRREITSEYLRTIWSNVYLEDMGAIIFCREWGHLFVGGQNLFQLVKGGSRILSHMQRGEQDSTCKGGDQKKIGDRPTQTDAPSQ